MAPLRRQHRTRVRQAAGLHPVEQEAFHQEECQTLLMQFRHRQDFYHRLLQVQHRILMQMDQHQQRNLQVLQNLYPRYQSHLHLQWNHRLTL